MSEGFSRLGRRIAKVERDLMDFADRHEPGGCNCRAMTLADPYEPEQFEAEMDKFCRFHIPRRLGRIVLVVHKCESESEIPNRLRLEQALKVYRSRVSPIDYQVQRIREVGRALKKAAQTNESTL